MIVQTIAAQASAPVNINLQIRKQAAQVVDQPDFWMSTPLEQLGFKSPNDVIREFGAQGAALIQGVLDQMREGVFS